MTEQTVSIPVELLKRLRDDRQLRYVEPSGALYNVHGDAMDPLIAFIPDPPKVGDKLTAREVRSLPFRTVVVDRDGDPWVLDEGGRVFLYNDSETIVANRDYEPYTLVHLPRD